MEFETVDRYLLGEPVSKSAALETLLSNRSDAPAAAPFYRGLEAVGARAADEAFVALRLVLAGRSPDDAAVRRLRALASIARASATGDRKLLKTCLKRDGPAIADLLPPADSGDEESLARLGAWARDAYARELGLAGDRPR